MSGVTDITSIVSAGATCVALLFAGFELRRSRAHDLHNRRVEIEGVAVSWVPIEVPRTAQNGNGSASWVYNFTVSNPGQLPISDVRVEIFFALEVQRVRYDGYADDRVDHLVMVTPVLAGGRERTWRRRLLLNYAESENALPQTRAVVSFVDPDDPDRRQHNYWPKHLPEVRKRDIVQSSENFRQTSESSPHSPTQDE